MTAQVRRPSRLLGLLRLTVVAAAGVGGWFAYDEYVAADVVDEADEPPALAIDDPLTPWPLDLVVADEPWPDGYVETVQVAGQAPQSRTEFDAAAGRARTTLFDTDGSTLAVLEVDRDEEWIDRGEGFERVDEDSVSATRRLALTPSAMALHDILDPAVWPYTTLRGESPGPSSSMPTRVFGFTIEAGAFANSQPAVAAHWRATNPLRLRSFEAFDIDVEVDAVGHVLSATFPSGGESLMFRWEPLAQTPTFTSPISD